MWARAYCTAFSIIMHNTIFLTRPLHSIIGVMYLWIHDWWGENLSNFKIRSFLWISVEAVFFHLFSVPCSSSEEFTPVHLAESWYLKHRLTHMLINHCLRSWPSAFTERGHWLETIRTGGGWGRGAPTMSTYTYTRTRTCKAWRSKRRVSPGEKSRSWLSRGRPQRTGRQTLTSTQSWWWRCWGWALIPVCLVSFVCSQLFRKYVDKIHKYPGWFYSPGFWAAIVADL